MEETIKGWVITKNGKTFWNGVGYQSPAKAILYPKKTRKGRRVIVTDYGDKIVRASRTTTIRRKRGKK